VAMDIARLAVRRSSFPLFMRTPPTTIIAIPSRGLILSCKVHACSSAIHRRATALTNGFTFASFPGSCRTSDRHTSKSSASSPACVFQLRMFATYAHLLRGHLTAAHPTCLPTHRRAPLRVHSCATAVVVARATVPPTTPHLDLLRAWSVRILRVAECETADTPVSGGCLSCSVLQVAGSRALGFVIIYHITLLLG
jgi:hypothetical protein